MSSENTRKFEISYLRELLNSRLNSKKDEMQEKMISDMITQDKLDLMALENISEHKKISEIINAIYDEILEIYDTIHFILQDIFNFSDGQTSDTVRASNFRECVSKMIEHEMQTHPEMPQKQAIAVAYKKCKKRFTGDEYIGFKKLVEKLKKQGVSDPEALAAWIGRKKYGAKKFANLRKKKK